mmetsp:Transcript_24996/g.70412  ORF Transcript_24996/g.70412 Transcript_24996/m.70412 type:complete len:346 (-) Transcript_24996:11-1048(-)
MEGVSPSDGVAPSEPQEVPAVKILPKIPREHDGLPTYHDLPDDFRDKVPNKTKRVKPYARLFCFYGIGDSAGQWMRDFVNNGALWCEMAVYEYKGHGTREEEEFDASYDDRVDDAWEAMEPALQQQVPGGPAEGCPWAIFAHSAGCVMACSIAARAREKLGLEPTVVYMVDQAPPNVPFLTDEGYELMCKEGKPLESSFDWMTVWCPDKARSRGKAKLADQIYDRWSYGMRILEDFYRSAEEAYHVFHCPLVVFIGGGALMQREHAKKGHKKPTPPKKRVGLPTVEEISTVTYEDHLKWKRWTTGTCQFFEVPAAHHEVWYHIETDTKLWQTFLGLTSITPEHLK